LSRFPALGLSLLVTSALLLADRAGLFRAQDLRTWDLFLRARGERPADDRIAIVEVDDATVRAYGAWPLSRDTYALLLEALEESRARAIGFDLLFLDSDPGARPQDLLLATVSSKYSNVVHAIAASQEIDEADPGRTLPPNAIAADSLDVARAGGIALPFDALARSSGALGHVSVMVDPDGIVRRVPLLLRHGADLHPAMALRLVGLALRWPDPLELRSLPQELAVRRGDATPLRLPLDEEGGTAFRFTGGRGAFAHTFSMVRVLQAYRDGRRDELTQMFGDRIVIVGVTAVGEAAADVGATPFSSVTPLVYVHANLVDALLRGAVLRDAPRGAVLGALTLLAAALAVLLANFSLRWGAVAAVVVLAAVGLGQFLLTMEAGLRAVPTASLLVPPSVLAAVTAYRLVFLERGAREWGPVARTLRAFRGRLSRGAGEDARREIGSYRLEQLLGRGGMGEVWRASHRMLERPAAVKLIRRDALGMANPQQALATLQQFEREAQATANLQSVNTVAIYDFGVDDERTFYYAMELLDGLSLDDLVRRFGPVPPQRAIHLLLQVCDSLEDAHRHQMVHRDIKPANVFVCRKGQRVDHVKVLDFGLVQRQERLGPASSAGRRSAIAGTPAFMSPEQALGRADIDGRADLYSVGCVAYWLITGDVVFERESARDVLTAHIREAPDPPSQVSELPVPPDLERVILACLEKDPEKRPATAAALADRLRACECSSAWSTERAEAWWAKHLPRSESGGAAATGAEATRPLSDSRGS
jgi:CHASE2 domain-containing sensor protein